MLRVFCPKCRMVLNVEALQAGSLARCPACTQVFRVPFMPVSASPPADTVPELAPAPGPPEPAPVPQAAAPPGPTPSLRDYDIESLEILDESRASEPYDVVAELVPVPAPEPVPPDDEVIEAVEEVPEDEPPVEGRRPRRKRRRPRRGPDAPEPQPAPRRTLLPGISNFALLLIGLGALWINLGSCALLIPSLAPLLMGVGGILAVVGQVWFLMVAFRDDAATGFLCIIVPFYSLYFLTRSPVEAGRPFALAVAGYLILASGIAIHAGAG